MMKRRITTSDVLALSPAERIDLMHQIWDTLGEPDEAFELTDELKRELDRRWRAYKRNPKRARLWDDAKADLLRRSRRTG